jgi:site-specific recombinase XerD
VLTRVQKSTKCTNRRDALDVEHAYRTQHAKREVGLEVKKPIPLFRDALRTFPEWSKGEHMAKPNKYRRIETAIKAVVRFFENKKLDQISVQDVEDFKQWRVKQKKLAPKRKLQKNKKATTNVVIKPATVNKELACLRSMVNYFIKMDVIIKNTVSHVKFLREDNEQTRESLVVRKNGFT